MQLNYHEIPQKARSIYGNGWEILGTRVNGGDLIHVSLVVLKMIPSGNLT
jgi:hypothetical protein